MKIEEERLWNFLIIPYLLCILVVGKDCFYPKNSADFGIKIWILNYAKYFDVMFYSVSKPETSICSAWI